MLKIRQWADRIDLDGTQARIQASDHIWKPIVGPKVDDILTRRLEFKNRQSVMKFSKSSPGKAVGIP